MPKTYEEMLALGAEAKGKDKYLLGWGKEAATYYQTMAISSAIKQGGDEVRLALENLKPDCWSQPADAGRVHRSEEDHRRRVRQAGWRGDAVHGRPVAVEQCAGLHPVPVGRLDRERDEEADQGGLRDDRGAGAGRRPATSPRCRGRRCTRPRARATSSRRRARTSPAARSSCGPCCPRRRRSTSPRRPSPRPSSRTPFPADGFGSTALVSQVKLLEAAGANVFTWNFIDLYGLNTDHAGGMEHLPPGRIERRRADQGPAGDHRQDRQRRLDQESRGAVTAVDTTAPAADPGECQTPGLQAVASSQSDLRPGQLLPRVPRGSGRGLPRPSWSRRSSRRSYYSLTSWSGFSPDMALRRPGELRKIFKDGIFLKSMGNSMTLVIVLPIVTLIVA